MKIGITGHTSGLGKAIYDHFNGHELLGMSRSNGFDLETRFDDVVDIAKTCDLFINNAHVGITQARLIEALYQHVPIITSGSMAVQKIIGGGPYHAQKRAVESAHVKFKKATTRPMLLLRLGYLENAVGKNNTIPFETVLGSIDFWLAHQRISQIEIDNIPD